MFALNSATSAFSIEVTANRVIARFGNALGQRGIFSFGARQAAGLTASGVSRSCRIGGTLPGAAGSQIRRAVCGGPRHVGPATGTDFIQNQDARLRRDLQ
jgi:hypothetical protein